MKRKLLKKHRYTLIAIIFVMLFFIFYALGRESNNAHSTVPASKIGSGIVLTNTEVYSPYGYLCNYKIQQTNNSVGSQDIKIQITATRKDGYPVGNFNWEDSPLYTGSPRIDYLDNLPCTTDVDDNGVTQLFYTISNSAGKEMNAGYIDVSTNYLEAPTPTLSFTLQNQCGQEARDYIKQNPSQDLLESAYSNQLHACIAYTEDNNVALGNNILAPTDKTIFNISANKALGGYIYIAPLQVTPTPPSACATKSGKENPFMKNMCNYTNSATSQYWIANNDPAQQNVTFNEFNRYKQSLGLTPSDQFGE